MDLNVVRRISIEATAKGIDDATAKLQKLGVAQGGIAATSEKTEKATLSVERALDRQRRALDENYRAMKQFERAQADLDRARKQGLVGAAEFGRLTELNRQRMAAATQTGKSYSAMQNEVRGSAMAAAAAIGPLGSVVSGLGPVGLVAAAGLGAALLAINGLVKASGELADAGGKMVDFAETTGLTTTQLQALQKAGAMVGVEAEKIGQGFERFSVQIEELRRGTGGLFEGLNRLDPALARQLATTRSAAEAWDLFAKAVAGASREEANALAKAAFGRSGIPMTRLAGATTEAGGTAGLERSLAEIDTLTTEQLKHWDELKDKIDFTSKLAKQNLASIFAGDVLKMQLQYEESWLRFSQSAKSFSLSGDYRYLLETMLQLQIGGEGTWLHKFFGIDFKAGYKNPAGDAASFEDRFAPAQGSLKPYTPAAPGGGGAATDPRFDAAVLQKRIAAMGDAATAAEKLQLAELKLAASAKEAGLSQEQYNRALAGLRSDHALDQMRNTISALGSGATVTEILTYKIARLGQELAKGEINWETYGRAVDAANKDNNLQRERDRVNALGDAATAADRYKLTVMELGRQLEQEKISQETFNQAVAAADPVMKELKETAESFATTFVQGMIDGKSATEALSASMSQLGKTLVNTGINKMLNATDTTTFMIGAAQTAAGYVAQMFGAQSAAEKARKEAEMEQAEIQKQRKKAAIELREQFELRRSLVGIDTSTQAGALEAFDLNAKAELRNLRTSKQGARVALEDAIAAERLQIIKEFAEAAAAAEKERLDSYKDRIFAAGLDMTKLADQLALFDRNATRERKAEAEEGGGAMVELEQALAAERMNVIKDFNDAALEETKRAEQERLNALKQAARGVLEYILQLQQGASSPLSPGARFDAAQLDYNQTRDAAMAGDLEAYNRFTQVAESYRLAAEAMFGSSAGYQDVFNNLVADALNLTAPQAASDPLLAAMFDVVAAVGVANESIIQGADGTYEAVTANTEATGLVKNAVDLSTNATNTQGGLVAGEVNLGTQATSALQAALNDISTYTNEAKGHLTNIQTYTNDALASLGSISTNTNGALGDLSTIKTNSGTANTHLNNVVTHTNAAKGHLANVVTHTSDAKASVASIATSTGAAGTLTAAIEEIEAQVLATGGANGTVTAAIEAAKTAVNNVHTESLKATASLGKVDTATAAAKLNLDAVKGSTAAAKLNLDTVKTATSAASTKLGTVITQTTAASTKLGSVITQTTAAKTSLAKVDAATAAAKTSLGTVTTNTGNTVTAIGGTTGASVKAIGNEQGSLDAEIGNVTYNLLQKIKVATRRTAANTGGIGEESDSGGLFGWFQHGGIVGNGIYGRDSVSARYAGGGNIMLAGGEGVLTSAATTAIGGRSAVDHINRTGMMPSNDNGGVIVAIHSMHRTVASLLARIAALEGKNANLTAALIEQQGDWREEDARKAKRAAGKPGR